MSTDEDDDLTPVIGIAATNELAEVPGALWLPASPANYLPRPQAQERPYDLVVIHITSGHARAKPVAEMWAEPVTPMRSAHFVVGQDGTIIQCVPLRFAAQHAHNCNSHSVGIEHCAREPNEPSFPAGDPGLPPSEAQLAASAQLVAYLLKAASLPVQFRVTVDGHNHADPKTTHTQCPDGAPWPWTKYLLMVQQAYDALPGGDEPPLVA